MSPWMKYILGADNTFVYGDFWDFSGELRRYEELWRGGEYDNEALQIWFLACMFPGEDFWRAIPE